MDTRPEKYDDTGENKATKDLRKVLKIGDNIHDIILVDDYKYFVKDNQKPFIEAINIYRWNVKYRNNSEENFYKNATYFLLGIFKTYFEQEEYSKYPIRKAIEILYQKDYVLSKNHNKELMYDDSFRHKMICLGLEEIRKFHPEAVYYGCDRVKWLKLSPDPSQDEETKKKILGEIVDKKRSMNEPTIKVFWDFYEFKEIKRKLEAELEIIKKYMKRSIVTPRMQACRRWGSRDVGLKATILGRPASLPLPLPIRTFYGFRFNTKLLWILKNKMMIKK
jgi:hypothetical protein